MDPVKIFGVACGVIFGLTFMLLFNRKLRGSVMARSTWLSEHPRFYPITVALCALAVLGILYIISLRFV